MRAARGAYCFRAKAGTYITSDAPAPAYFSACRTYFASSKNAGWSVVKGYSFRKKRFFFASREFRKRTVIAVSPAPVKRKFYS
jgi:hypothetical protein